MPGEDCEGVKSSRSRIKVFGACMNPLSYEMTYKSNDTLVKFLWALWVFFSGIWFGFVAVAWLPLLHKLSCAEQVVETAWLSGLGVSDGCPVASAVIKMAEPILIKEG